MKSAGSSSGIRELLIAERQRSLQRWAIPGKPDEWLEDLRAHVPVVVSASQLLVACMRAGLPYRQFAFGGSEHGKMFILERDDQLREYDGVGR